MKLYATVTSERASKGQGGNKFLNTIFSIEKEVPRYQGDVLEVARVEMIRNTGGTTTIRFISLISEEQLTIEAETRFNKEKGKKQKTAKVLKQCENCGADRYDLSAPCSNCHQY